MFIEIYGRLSCPYCIRAILLAKKMKSKLEGVDFKFINMTTEKISKADLEPRVGKTVATVPQIFIDNQYIGGCTEFQLLIKETLNIS